MMVNFFFISFLNSELLTITKFALLKKKLNSLFLKKLLDHPEGDVFDLTIIFLLKIYY